MLKGRSKSFAPKKGPVRRPAGPSAPSSTRPSVERQSQTPAPSLPAEEESIPNAEQNRAAEETRVPEQSQETQQNQTENQTGESTVSVEARLPSNPNPKLSEAPTSQTSQDPSTTTLQKEKGLKRKSREENIQEPPAKRVSLESQTRPEATPEVLHPSEASIPQVVSDANDEQSSEERRVVVTIEAPPIGESDIAPELSRANTQESNELKRKSREDDVTEPPAKRISIGPEQHSESAPRTQNSSTVATAQDRPLVERATGSNLPPGEVPASANVVPEVQHVERSEGIVETIPEASRAPSRPEIAEDPILPSIETNERERSSERSPERDASSEAPRYQYPSPENMTRVIESEALGTPANMGPPGGSLGAPGDVAAIV